MDYTTRYTYTYTYDANGNSETGTYEQEAATGNWLPFHAYFGSDPIGFQGIIHLPLHHLI